MKTIHLIANGDLRVEANRTCEAAQADMERRLVAAIEKLGGARVKRAHPFDPEKKHGFIDSQKYGMEVFRKIPINAPLIVAESVWQYSHHILHGLLSHRGPILTIANWSGTWPGLVGLLNLNGSLTKAGVKYSSLWSENFDDDYFRRGIKKWLQTGRTKHDASHVRPLADFKVPGASEKVGRKFAATLRKERAIMGVFDEGCMGMYNAIIPDELLNATGIFKERLSQSSLYAKMLTVTDQEARAVYDWYLRKELKFHFGANEETELTEAQVLQQCKMYIAAVRIADEFGCATIGIQYQQGLKDLCPASDLVEGTLNNEDRPPVFREGTREELYKGRALPHFNEVDECAGHRRTGHRSRLAGIRLRTRKHSPRSPMGPAIQRQGRPARSSMTYVWVFLISGAAPPKHFIGGWKGAESSASLPCTGASAEERFAGSASRAGSSGAASTSPGVA